MTRSTTPSLRPATRPEVLAPVGGWPQLDAAIENGADAVYFGLDHFNARARAANFSTDELPEVMARLHERGVLGFVTFNTLLFDEELERAEAMIRAMADSGVDAVIVQDLGAVRLIRQVSPDLPIHGSTQMTITSAEGAEVIAAMGVERVVLARELSCDDVADIRRATDVELEVFVHGALCVSYSGQCFSSEAWGGRSANRGQCAQACRLPYDLLVDGELRPMGDVRYLLSPQDLMGVDHVEALIDAGVSCFKIEGRLKGPEYVALTTRTYREAIDRVWAGRAADVSRQRRRELTQVFSRGMTPGFLAGVQHQRLVDGRAPRHRGVFLGQVAAVDGRGVHLELAAPVKRGDGLVFDAGDPQSEEQGGRLYEIFLHGRPSKAEDEGRRVELRFGPGVDLSHVHVGDRVFKTRDEALEGEIRKTFEGGPHRREPIDALVTGAEGTPLTLTLRDRQGRTATARTDFTLVTANNRGLDEARLRKFLGRLGNTPFDLRSIDVQLDGALFAPTSALNEVRRQAADALTEARRRPTAWPSRPEPALPGMLGQLLARPAHAAAEPALTVLCRTMPQVEAALDLPDVHEVYIDFLDIKGIQAATRAVQAAHKAAVAVAPRVLKVKEERIWRFFLNLGADAILVRGLGLLHTLRSVTDEPVPPLYGDFSLNAANALTVDFLLEQGLERLAPGHDLNVDQLCALASAGPADRLELIAHHHLPIFHTEHCVFCRFLSDGDNFRNCGRPCDRHGVHLRDHHGREHVVLADMGCRNTVFNAEAQSAAPHLPDLLAAGYRRFRLELLEEAPDQVAPLVARYTRALHGELQAPDLWRWLNDTAPHGVTLGSLIVSPEQRSMKPTAWMDPL